MCASDVRLFLSSTNPICETPCVISPKMLCAIVGVLALQSPPVGRRAVIRAAAAGALSTSFSALPAFAKPTELASLSNEERLVLAKKRQEAENVAGLPINRLKDKRDRLSTADTLSTDILSYRLCSSFLLC